MEDSSNLMEDSSNLMEKIEYTKQKERRKLEFEEMYNDALLLKNINKHFDNKKKHAKMLEVLKTYK